MLFGSTFTFLYVLSIKFFDSRILIISIIDNTHNGFKSLRIFFDLSLGTEGSNIKHAAPISQHPYIAMIKSIDFFMPNTMTLFSNFSPYFH